jgi:hypothetical protein
MGLKAVLKFSFVCALILICALSTSSSLSAQDDPNSQYILVQSGELSSETREIEVPVEVGVLRLQFNLQHSGDVNWTIISPSDRPLDTSQPNLTISDTKEKRSILMWDPRPGRWKIRLSGAGRFTASVTAQGELYICCIQFFGRNGVYAMDRFQPLRGARQQAQIYASGYNIDVIEFQLINEQGQLIAPIKFRQSDYSNPYNFTLMIDTPDRPFRVLARGRDLNGKSFQRVIGWLVRPQMTDPSGAQTEAGGGQQTQQWATPQEWNKNLVEGEYKIVRAQIVSWKDEPLLSEKGNPIGIRLKYSIRFPADGSYSPLPSVYPERTGYGFTGALGMRPLKGSVEPTPDGLPQSGQWLTGARGIFKSDTVYHFTVDLIPNYAIFNEQKRAFCLQTKSYAQPGMRERFEREVMSEARIRYRLAISGTDLDGRQPAVTENAYAPLAWYQGYLKEGAGECQ